MNRKLLDQIAEAVLYEGYILYPYRPTAKKNAQERFTFGRVYPRAYSQAQDGAEACEFQAECLVQTNRAAMELQVEARFLQPMAREIAVIEVPSFRQLPELRLGEEVIYPWMEAVERRVHPEPLFLKTGQAAEITRSFSFAPTRQVEPLNHPENTMGAVLIREQHELEGELQAAIQPLRQGLFKIIVRICNHTAVESESLENKEAILMRTFASTHVTLCAKDAEFISLLDPPAGYQAEAAACKNSGLWPVLVGNEAESERNMMLASPIILYDYPKIAPESAGPLFDGTEIDEILSLRILTMTDEEKREMRNVDALARALLERTEALSATDMWQLHGAKREPSSPRPSPPREERERIDHSPFVAPMGTEDDLQNLDQQIFGTNTRLAEVPFGDRTLKNGDRVRICPKGRADVMDLALAGRTAVVESVEEDAERRVHLALVLDDDPGKDLGLDKQTGHRFFFGLDEVEAIG